MDIRQWLEHTADREPPDECVETGFPAFLQPQPNPVQPKRKSRPKRKRASSDSLGHAHQVSTQPFSAEQVRDDGQDAEDTSSRSSSSSSLRSRQSTFPGGRRVLIKAFSKRARHKTKPDRYKSKPKHGKKEHKASWERKPESRRRRSHRSGDGARTTGLVQSFQLKSGPKNQRLTLKLDASAGIFKNGRASGPIATSGPGLPDLVFNEMRFLRRPKEHQDEVPTNDPKKHTKKTQKQVHEEEISAYFNENLPPDKQTGLAKQDAVESRTSKQSAPQQPNEPVLEPFQHPVELPEKAFLGFGSRGPPHDGIESQHPSNSYYTWSESLSSKPSLVPPRPIVPAFDPTNDRSARQDQLGSHVPDTPPRRMKARLSRAKQSRSLAGAGGRIESQRVKGLERFEVHRALENAPLQTSAVEESSEPLPKENRGLNDAHFNEIHDRWETRSYHTSDILRIRDPVPEAGRSLSLTGRGQEGNPLVDKENEDPITSTPTSERLRHAFRTVTKPETRAAGEVQVLSCQAHEERRYTQSRPSSVRRDRSRDYVEVAFGSPKWTMPRRGFSRTNDANRQQENPVCRLVTASISQTARQQQPLPMEAPRSMPGPNHEHEEEMLKVLPRAAWTRLRRHSTIPDSREAEALMRYLGSEGEAYRIDANVVESAIDGYDYEEQEGEFETESAPQTTNYEPELFSFNIQQDDGMLSREQFQGEYFTVDHLPDEDEFDNGHREVANHEFTAFWRPNILY